MSLVATANANELEQAPRQIAFERARNAAIIIQPVRPMLTPAQLETLALLVDNDVMETIGQSIEEAKRGEHRPLEEAIEEIENE